MLPKQLNFTADFLLSFVRTEKFTSAVLISSNLSGLLCLGWHNIYLYLENKFFLNPFEKQPLYKHDSVSPLITYILNGIFNSTLPVSKQIEKKGLKKEMTVIAI